MERKTIYKSFSFPVDNPDQSYTKKFELDRNIRLVTGIQMSSNSPVNLFYRGSQKIEINGEELYPENYESRLLMSSINVAPDQRFIDLGNGVLSGNGEVKLLYKDQSGSFSNPFQPYNVSIILRCELK